MKKLFVVLLIVGVVVAFVVPKSAIRSSAQAPIDANLLVWDYIQGEDDGQLERLTTAGEPTVLVDFPTGVFDNRAMQCSQDYWVANGQNMAVFTGAAEGTIALYPVAGGDPVVLGTASRMACAGPKTFQVSPDGQRAGYIDYARDAIEKEFPSGNLIFVEAATGNQLASFDWATDFSLYNDGALMLRFYPDGKGNATEADLDWWDGSARRTLVTLEPVYPPDKKDLECGLTGGTAVRIGTTAYVLSGQKCADGSRGWRVVSVPMTGGPVTEIASGVPVGSFFPESFTALLLPAQDGSGFLLGLPSGLTRNTDSLFWLGLDGKLTPILEGRHILMDRFGERLSEARQMMVSLDGSKVAFVSATADGLQTLWMLNLASASGEPAMLDEEGANQRIFELRWSVNNALFYAGGSIESSSLHVVSPDGTDNRLARGRFFRIAPNYTGDKVAAAEWVANPQRAGDDLFKLTLMNTSGVSFTVLEGGDQHNQLIPLAVQ